MLKLNRRTLAAAAVMATASVPSPALARVNLNPVPAPPPAATAVHQGAIAPAVPRSEVTSSQGFRWDDAGVGAAGIVVLLGVGAGSAAVITRRRGHPTRVG